MTTDRGAVVGNHIDVVQGGCLAIRPKGVDTNSLTRGKF